ncbi:MAG: leucine-rich repeat protein [Bacteroidaceae bacterium]|nr:leucine-rich repeat protein [Bacteroidaceae bacterium]
MKINCIKMIMAALMLMCSTAVYAYDFEVDGIYYKVTSRKHKTVEVSHKKGVHYKGNVVIPATTKHEDQTYQVTGVGRNAFWGCNDMTSITLPDSLEHLGRKSLAYCNRLKGVCVPDKVKKVGRNAFVGSYSLEYVSLPTAVDEKIKKMGIAKHVVLSSRPQGPLPWEKGK